MLKEGDAAPEIHVETDSGAPFDLKGLRGKKVVLYFFPRANTSG